MDFTPSGASTTLGSGTWNPSQISWPQGILHNLDSILRHRKSWAHHLDRPVRHQTESREIHISLARGVLSQTYAAPVSVELAHLVPLLVE